MIPTSIDGTDITGATIDGTDVQEITVDGQTVFSAGPSNLPVAYSNLVAWYPFDSATYGGSNADDVTAILGGSGDDTAYDGTVNGPTYQSSGGVTDINAGANSGAFDFPNQTDSIDITGVNLSSNEWTAMAWHNGQNLGDLDFVAALNGNSRDFLFQMLSDDGDLRPIFTINGTSVNLKLTQLPSAFYHYCMQYDNGTVKSFLNGQLDDSASAPNLSMPIDEWSIGNREPSRAVGSIDDSAQSEVDDFRLYNTALSDSQINQIYQNTKP